MASTSNYVCTTYKLAPEDSDISHLDDSESIDSTQNQETDFVEDTPDTETKSECSDDDSEYSQVEFEVNSSDEPAPANVSTATDEDLITAGTIAAVLCDSSLGASWVSDDEETTDDSLAETELKRIDYWTCVSCKNCNNNPLYRFCQRCFQERKQSFPPRPRKRRRSKTLAVDKVAGSSQDSGIASLTECSKRIKTSESDKHIVRIRRLSDVSDRSGKKNSTDRVDCKRKSLSGNLDAPVENKRIKLEDQLENKGPLPETKELCTGCNARVKDGIFIHGQTAHLCFCYKCSVQTWKSTKRCPICNRRVGNVVKVFIS